MKNHIENDQNKKAKEKADKKSIKTFTIVAVCLVIIFNLIPNRINKCDCLKLLESRGYMTGYELEMLGYSGKEVKDQKYCIRKYDYSQDFILKCWNE